VGFKGIKLVGTKTVKGSERLGEGKKNEKNVKD